MNMKLFESATILLCVPIYEWECEVWRCGGVGVILVSILKVRCDGLSNSCDQKHTFHFPSLHPG